MPRGKMLTTAECREQFGLSDSVLRRARQDPRLLNGRTIYHHPGSGKRPTRYSESDVRELANLKRLHDGAFEDAAGVWLTAAHAIRDFRGFHLEYFTDWRKSCPELGRAIEAQQRCVWTEKGTLNELWFYLQADLREIRITRRTAPHATHNARHGTANEILDAMPITRGAFYRATGRGTLKVKSEFRRVDSLERCRSVPTYSFAECEKAFGVESDPDWLLLSEAADACAVGYSAMWKWLNHCNLLGRPLKKDRKRAKTPDGRVTEQWHIHRSEIAAIAAAQNRQRSRAITKNARQERTATTGEGEDWMPATLVETEYAIPVKTLHNWRENFSRDGTLPPHRFNIRCRKMPTLLNDGREMAIWRFRRSRCRTCRRHHRSD